MSIVVALLVGMLLGWAVRHTSAQLDRLLEDARLDEPCPWELDHLANKRDHVDKDAES